MKCSLFLLSLKNNSFLLILNNKDIVKEIICSFPVPSESKFIVESETRLSPMFAFCL